MIRNVGLEQILKAKLKATESDLYFYKRRVSELELVLQHHRVCHNCDCPVSSFEGLGCQEANANRSCS